MSEDKRLATDAQVVMSMVGKSDVIGSPFGLAIVDAMGQPIEFLKRDTSLETTGFISGGMFQPASWSADGR